MADTYRWITYITDPQVVDSELGRVRDLDDARDAFRAHCRTRGTEAATMRLYVYDDMAWEDAREFESYGCPFDYPDHVLSIGQFGTVDTESA